MSEAGVKQKKRCDELLVDVWTVFFLSVLKSIEISTIREQYYCEIQINFFAGWYDVKGDFWKSYSFKNKIVTDLFLSFWMHIISKTDCSQMLITHNRWPTQDMGKEYFCQINFELILSIWFDQIEKGYSVIFIYHSVIENPVDFMAPKPDQLIWVS